MGLYVFLLKRDCSWSPDTCIWIPREALPFFRTLLLLSKLRGWLCDPQSLLTLCFSSFAYFPPEFLFRGWWSEYMGHFPSVLRGLTGFWEALRGLCKCLITFSSGTSVPSGNLDEKTLAGLPYAQSSTLSLPRILFGDRWLLLLPPFRWGWSWDGKVSC